MALVFVECTRQGFGGIFLIFSPGLSCLAGLIHSSRVKSRMLQVVLVFSDFFLDTVFSFGKMIGTRALTTLLRS